MTWLETLDPQIQKYNSIQCRMTDAQTKQRELRKHGHLKNHNIFHFTDE